MSFARQEWHERQRQERLEAICQEAGLKPDTQPGIVADFLEEQGRPDLAREVRENLDPATQPIYSTKKMYPVGKRHEYVYYLVKDAKSLNQQQEGAAEWCDHYRLNEDERLGLANLLSDFNRRSRPYWSSLNR